MAATFVFGQHIHFRLVFRMRRNRTRGRDHHAAFQFVLVDTAQQQTDVVAGNALVQNLLEHFHARHHGLFLQAQTDDLNLVVDLHASAFHAAGTHGAATLNRKHIFNRHQERLVHIALRRREIRIHRVHQVHDALVGHRILIIIQRLQRRPADNRYLIAREIILFQ
ncbi:MAG: hypothetical protein A4E62_03199 [Syntrophorhabdus sp. PtaU1.Bin002]|nr:MAG: hypothetical protein A4E62_03199 [Syntrophorhabdus sp. PtaU1.Bin002]